MQQLQFWRRESSSREMEPEAPRSERAAESGLADTAALQTGQEQGGALDDVDTLMAQLAERQVSHHATHAPQHKSAMWHILLVDHQLPDCR